MIVSVGDLLVDAVCWLQQPLRRGTDAFSSTSFHRGGSAANVAHFVATLGSPIRFVGAVGDDLLGRSLVDELRVVGVEVCAPIIAGRSTGTVIVLVEPDGERTMVPDRGASAELCNPDPTWLDGATVLHVPLYAFGIEPLATTAKTLIEWAHQREIIVSIDMSSVALIDQLGPTMIDALAQLLQPSIVFANADESKVSGAFASVPCFVEKRGPDPVRCFVDGTLVEEITVPTLPSVRDTTGAGDAFAAGFLVQRNRDWSPRSCAEAGIAVAVRVLRTAGASS